MTDSKKDWLREPYPTKLGWILRGCIISASIIMGIIYYIFEFKKDFP
jgi:hypothetical protein